MNNKNLIVSWWTMNKLYLVLLVIIATCLLAGCAKTFDNIEEYEKFIKGEDYPYLKTETKKGIKVSARYMPTDGMLLHYYKSYETDYAKTLTDTTLTAEQIQDKIENLKTELTKQRKAFPNSIYFILTIGFEDESRDIIYDAMNTGFDNYSEWLQRLSFGMKEFIYLKTPKAGKVPLAIYDMERTFGMTKSRSLLLNFPKEFNETRLLKDKELKLVIKEFGLHTGRFIFEFKTPFKEIKLNNKYLKGE